MIDSEMVALAATYAAAKHRMQMRRDGSPYIAHPRRVAEAVSALSGATATMIAAAHLHDVIEDCAVTEEQLRFVFGEDVAVIVAELSHPKVRIGNRSLRIAAEQTRLRSVSHAAKRIKMCDRYDNLTDTGVVTDADRRFRVQYAKETLGLLRAIGDADLDLSNRLYDVVAGILGPASINTQE